MSLEKIFKDGPIELIAKAEYMAEQTNDFQVIKSFMNNRFNDLTSLTPQQELKMKRWQFIYDQSSTGKYTDADIRNQLVTHFKITEHQAWDDMRKSQELFTKTLHFDKKFKMMIDLQLLDLMRAKAISNNDIDGFAKLQKQRNDLYRLIPDEEEQPGDYFKPIQLNYAFNPEYMGKTRVPSDKMKSLIEMLKEEHGITDIDYEILNDDDNGAETPTP